MKPSETNAQLIIITTDRDPDITLEQLHPLAAMNGVFLVGRVTRGESREGEFFIPSWRRWDLFRGEYTVSKKIARFWLMSKPRQMNDDEVKSKLSFVYEDLANISLRRLENGYESLRRNLQRTESIRDTYLALMKSLPYVIISLLVALFTTSVYELGIGSYAIFASLVASVVFSGLFLVAYFESRVKDSFIATLRIYCDKVNAVMAERRMQISKRFQNLVLKPPIHPTDYRISFEDVVRGNKDLRVGWEPHFGSDLSKDIEYGYPLVYQKVNEFARKMAEYVECIESFQNKARDLILELSKTDRLGIPSGSVLSEMTRALYLTCASIVSSEPDLAREKKKGFSDSSHLAEEYVSRAKKKGYGTLTEDKELTRIAADSEARFVACQTSHDTLTTTMRFVFGSR